MRTWIAVTEKNMMRVLPSTCIIYITGNWCRALFFELRAIRGYACMGLDVKSYKHLGAGCTYSHLYSFRNNCHRDGSSLEQCQLKQNVLT